MAGAACLVGGCVAVLLGLHFALNWGWVWDKTKKYILQPVAGVFDSKAAQENQG